MTFGWQSFVLTGTLKSLDRETAKQKIMQAAAPSLKQSPKNQFCGGGADPGSKAARAAALGVPQLSESEF